MSLKSALPALALGLVALCSTPTARGTESYDACTSFITTLPTTISTPGVWCLRADLATAINTGDAVNVTANNVTIACNGFKIGGLGGGVDSGAYGIHSYKRNTRVDGCHLRSFQTSVAIEADAGLVEDSIIEAATVTGIYMFGTGHVVRHNRFIDIGGAAYQASAVYVDGSLTMHDNLIDGVSSTASSVYAVLSDGELLVMNDNTVQGLVAPAEGGYAYGVNAEQNTLIMERNRFVTPDGGRSVNCTSSQSVVRDNTFIGFWWTMDGCNDGGGNVFVLPDA